VARVHAHPRSTGPQFGQQRVLSHFFSLLLTAAFATIMAKRKATDEELEARAESNGYRSPFLLGAQFSWNFSPRIFAKLRHNMHLRCLSTSATSPIPCNRMLQPAEMDEGPCLVHVRRIHHEVGRWESFRLLCLDCEMRRIMEAQG